ncbi:hypothetical protein A4X13_0g2092 [Tilletia indica]|uniref:Ras-related protein RSR1 n=2 Tax=Tilletia TaxID=13289 RepID=A0A177TWF6_9BASI|nr:hypothetical protein A4X13_0g2092 [Tilletia indica]
MRWKLHYHSRTSIAESPSTCVRQLRENTLHLTLHRSSLIRIELIVQLSFSSGTTPSPSLLCLPCARKPIPQPVDYERAGARARSRRHSGLAFPALKTSKKRRPAGHIPSRDPYSTTRNNRRAGPLSDIPQEQLPAHTDADILYRMRETKIVLMGGGGVGKSALTIQFVKQIFLTTYNPTIEETFSKVVNIDGEDCAVEILDTAGTEQFFALKEIYMKSGHGFILVFSLTNLASVNELSPLREQIIRVKESKVPLVLVGNKSDLRANRQVPREIGLNMSKAWGNVPYYETSARKRVNVDEIFADIIRQCRHHEAANGGGKRPDGEKKKSKCVIC